MLLGPNGAHFSGSVETETLRAPPKKDLRLASLTRSLHMDAPDGMQFKSAAGSVGITSLSDLTIKSINGKVCWLKIGVHGLSRNVSDFFLFKQYFITTLSAYQ